LKRRTFWEMADDMRQEIVRIIGKSSLRLTIIDPNFMDIAVYYYWD